MFSWRNKKKKIYLLPLICGYIIVKLSVSNTKNEKYFHIKQIKADSAVQKINKT